MNIKYYRKNIYGQDLLYIVGTEGKAIQTLTGKKTIDRRDIAALESLGHIFELVHEGEY